MSASQPATILSTGLPSAGTTSRIAGAACNKATTTIRDAADAAALSGCKTYTGTIAVATDSDPVIELNGVQTLEGDFIAANNPSLTTLGGDGFVSISGTAELRNLPLLTNFTLPNWTSSGILILDSIPPPGTIQLSRQGQQISRMYIRNTTMPFIAGLTLEGSQMEVLEVIGNPYLQEVNLGVGNITDHATITDNGGDATVALPNLIYAYNLEIGSANQIELPQLQSVSNGMTISDSDISSLIVPELVFVGGDFHLTDNPHLSKLKMESLVNVQGDLNVVNNTELMSMDGLPTLSSIGGALDLEGSFDHVLLPSLHTVAGGIVMKSTNSLNCSEIPASMGHGVYTCNTNASPDDIGSGDSTADEDLSKGAIAGIAVGVVALLALIGLLVAAYAWLRLRRKRQADKGKEEHAMPVTVEKDEDKRISRALKQEHYRTKELPPSPPYPDSSAKETMSGTSGTEMGRPQSGSYPGPEGRYEMQTGTPAAVELPSHDAR